jgi:hypothetical protein
MTAPAGPPPKIVFAVGAPDGMTGAVAEQRFMDGNLHGISGITSAVLYWMFEHEHPFSVLMFGGERRLTDETIERWLQMTKGEVLVNLICEPETQRLALRQLASFELASQLPLVNPSWAVAATARPVIARRLAHQVGVRAPHCTLFRAGGVTLAEHIEAEGHTYPVLLRPPGRHGSVGLVRVDDPSEITSQARDLRLACTVTDFVDFRSDDGLWRKYRMVYAGDRLFRRHVLADREWNLTRAARPFMNDRPELVAQEQEWLGRPVTLERDGIEARIMHQFRALQLDFGVMDFALPPDGDLVVFEINACLQLTNPTDAEAATDLRYFEANNDEILATLAAAISVRSELPTQLRGPHAG